MVNQKNKNLSSLSSLSSLSNLSNSMLGRSVIYPKTYDPSLLFAIPRSEQRGNLSLGNNLKNIGVNIGFDIGFDIWRAYEVSWLDLSYKPQVAILTIEIPADSENIVESKSLKLYLNSFNSHVFGSKDQVIEYITKDLSKLCLDINNNKLDNKINISLESVDINLTNSNLAGICIDDLLLDMADANLKLDLSADLSVESDVVKDKLVKDKLVKDKLVKDKLYTNLFKSNCPITNQPDWASIYIEYHGKSLDHASVLSYLVSYRDHQDFHEHCVEKVYVDLYNILQPQYLAVAAFYTRRGGLDINPIRSSLLSNQVHDRYGDFFLAPDKLSKIRLYRQ